MSDHFLIHSGVAESERWVTADLHIHSVYSGGCLTPAEILYEAQQRLLEAAAIADHFQVRGALEGSRLARTTPGSPEILWAQEISLGDHFHLVVIGATEAWPEGHRTQLLTRLADHHRQGGIIILAHPWTVPRNGWGPGCLREMLGEGLLDAAELFNASILSQVSRSGYLLQSVWEELIAPYRLAVVGGSDFHRFSQGRFIGGGRTYLYVKTPGVSGIMEALRQRRTAAGLFSSRPFNLGTFGAGNSVIFGAEPWYGKLKDVIADLQRRLAQARTEGGGQLDPSLIRFWSSLLATGQYQHLQELLTVGII